MKDSRYMGSKNNKTTPMDASNATSFLLDDNFDAKMRFIIPLTSTWKSYFDLWMVILVGYSCFSTAY